MECMKKEITEKQRYAISIIEKYIDPYENSIKFAGTTRIEASDFIGKYYEEAKKNQFWDNAMFDAMHDPWGDS